MNVLVIVRMDKEIIEERYKKALEKAEKTYLDALIAKKTNGAEKVYRESVKKARQQYDAAYKKYLEKNKGQVFGKKKKKEEKKEDSKKNAMPLTRWEKIKMHYSMKWFRFRIAFRNTIRKPFFVKLIFSYPAKSFTQRCIDKFFIRKPYRFLRNKNF